MKAPVAWFGARPGLGLGYVSNKLERKRQFCFDDGAIVRFHYCDISAMALLRQHINQRFSVGTEAVARIQPETETTLALLMAQGGDLHGRNLSSALMRSRVPNRTRDRGG
jgi:hypothetical protein